MVGLNTDDAVKEYDKLALLIAREATSNFKNAGSHFFWLTLLRCCGVIAGGAAAVGAVIPDQKLFATIPAAVAGALYFIIQQLKLAERSNAHFKRYNALHLLSIELDVAALKGAKYETIEQVLRKYAKIIEDTDKIFAGITVSLGQPANTSSQDNVASKEADKHPIKPV